MVDENDSFYKREDDRQWRDRVNGRLAHLTSGETVQNDRLDALHEKIQKQEHLLEGDPEDRNDSGLKGDVRDMVIGVNKLNTILSIDVTGNPGFDRSGNPGYLKKVEIMWGGEQRKESRRKDLIPIIIAIIALLSANMERIEKWLKPTPQKPDRFHRMLERAKEPPGPRRKTIRYKVIPAPSSDSDNPDQPSPEENPPK